mgnify:CR=1 FL=1
MNYKIISLIVLITVFMAGLSFADVEVRQYRIVHEQPVQDFVQMRLSLNADMDIDASARVSIPELGVRAPLQRIYGRDRASMNFLVDVPADAEPGMYVARLYFRSGDDHRIVHRFVTLE